MIVDSFSSNTVSLVLSWAVGVFFVLSLTVILIVTLLGDCEGGATRARDRIFFSWIAICAIAVGPVRYFLLQLLLTETFGVQSFSAFFATVFLVLPVAAAFGILYAIGIALPLAGIAAIEGSKRFPSRSRRFLSILLSPVLFFLGSLLFFWALPYAAYSCHWFRAKDMMRATNGPAEYFYGFAVDWQIPYLSYPLVGSKGETAKERLRSHIVALYVGKKGMRHLTAHHYNRSTEFWNKSVELSTRDAAFFTLKQEEIDEIVEMIEGAVREARMADVEILNDRLDGLGDHYRDEYVVGMEKLILGHKATETLRANQYMLQGNSLIARWQYWHEEERNRIERDR